MRLFLSPAAGVEPANSRAGLNSGKLFLRVNIWFL